MLLLASCRIQGFRALGEAAMDFDKTTVLIGENGCGKSSLLRALEVFLGRGAPAGGFAILPSDFDHLSIESGVNSLRIELRFCEETPSFGNRWPKLGRAGLLDKSGRLNFALAVRASREDGLVTSDLEVPPGFLGDRWALLAELRRIVPFIRIRSGAYQIESRPDVIGQQPEQAARDLVEAEIRSTLARLVEVDTVSDETLAAAHAALEGVIDRFQGIDSPAQESRVNAPLSSTTSWSRLAGLLRGSGARSLAMLAFTGAFLHARGPTTLDADCSPLVSIEDPEVSLHPLMLTSVWSLIQSLPAQKLVTTNSADLLAAIPLDNLRRMVRGVGGQVNMHRVHLGQMSQDALRRIAYHLRVRRGTALFMRFWLLVEGETEFWLLPEAARALDIDLKQEGVECLEFAQSGLAPLATLGTHLGIGWHVLADGDKAGQHYHQAALSLAQEAPGMGLSTMLREKDIEHCLWTHGYAHVYRAAANHGPPRRRENPAEVISQAIKHLSKPSLALMLGEAMRAPGSPGVPPALAHILHSAVEWARHGRFAEEDVGRAPRFQQERRSSRGKRSRRR